MTRKTHLYRVESGCLCVYEPHSAEHRAIVEFAFAGDLLGLGYLENHTRSARAIGETRITCLPLSAVDRIVEASPRARDQLKQAIDDELEFVRDGLVKSGQRNPIERVAAFFVALSRGNSYEGRIPNIITNSLKCGVVASDLALSVEALSRILVELEERGLMRTVHRWALVSRTSLPSNDWRTVARHLGSAPSQTNPRASALAGFNRNIDEKVTEGSAA